MESIEDVRLRQLQQEFEYADTWMKAAEKSGSKSDEIMALEATVHLMSEMWRLLPTSPVANETNEQIESLQRYLEKGGQSFSEEQVGFDDDPTIDPHIAPVSIDCHCVWSPQQANYLKDITKTAHERDVLFSTGFANLLITNDIVLRNMTGMVGVFQVNAMRRKGRLIQAEVVCIEINRVEIVRLLDGTPQRMPDWIMPNVLLILETAYNYSNNGIVCKNSLYRKFLPAGNNVGN